MADTGSDPTVIGADIHIKGEMTFQKPVRLVGTFEGSIEGQGELQVAKGAACKANVTSSSIVVDGIVEGNLVAAEKVQLNASGVVRGDIVAGKMVMAEGSSFFGQCSVGPEAVKAAGAKTGGVGQTQAQAQAKESASAGQPASKQAGAK